MGHLLQTLPVNVWNNVLLPLLPSVGHLMVALTCSSLYKNYSGGSKRDRCFQHLAELFRMGNLELITWVSIHLKYPVNDPRYIISNLCGAAQAGHLPVLQFFLKEDTILADTDPSGSMCEAAAAGGHLDVLQYLRSREAPWTGRVFSAAASGGHINVLEYALQQGCPRTMGNVSVTGHYTYDLGLPGAAAAAAGSLDAIQWLRKHKFTVNNPDTFAAAAGRGHLHVLKCLFDVYRPAFDENVTANAAGSGNMQCFEWVMDRRNKKWPFSSLVCTAAARSGNIQVLRAAHGNGIPWDEETCAAAAESGHLEMLQYLRAEQCPWSSSTCNRAAKYGHFEVLRWARSNGCTWTSFACSNAAENGHLAILQWARSNGCEWDSYTSKRAAECGQLGTLEWALQNGCPYKLDELRKVAAGHHKVIAFLDRFSKNDK